MKSGGITEMNPSGPDQAVPNQWIDIVNKQCDLDLAFDILEGWNHFHTDTIRGRVRSLQLRPKEAWEFFSKAQARADANTPHNKIRTFYIKVYCFENALIDESFSEEGYQGDLIRHWIQQLLAETFDISKITYVQEYCQGISVLHEEEYAEAARIFSKLLEESGGRKIDELTGLYIAAAVAFRGLGNEGE